MPNQPKPEIPTVLKVSMWLGITATAGALVLLISYFVFGLGH